MLKAICRVSTIIAALCCASSPHNVSAQIAPTNSAAISGSVSDSASKPVANAKVSLTGPRSASTQTDAQGLFAFVGVPFGTYQISAAAQDLGTATRSVTVEGDTNVAIQYEPVSSNGLKTIAHVSAPANAQFNVSPASVTQVNPMQEAFQGETSWRKILEQIPGVNQAGLYNGSNTLASMPDSPLVPMQISIDGTLPYETATLLDGMPLIGSSYSVPAGSGTNIGSYGLNSFSSADVVRGPGANSPSIVDSIGGSFLLHPAGIVTQNHYELSVSTDPYGGIITNALVAVHFNKLSVLATYGAADSPGPLASAGTAVNTVPLLSVNGNMFSTYYPPGSGFIFNPNYSGFPYEGYKTGLLVSGFNFDSAWSTHSGSLALSYVLSPTVTVAIFYAGSTATQRSTPAYTDVNFAPPSGYGGGIAPGLYTFSYGGGFLNETPFDQASSLLEEKITAQIGRGILHLAALQNRTYSTCSYATPDTANVRLFGAGYLNGSSTLTFFNGNVYTIVPQPNSYLIDRWTDNRDLLATYTTSINEKYHVGASYVKSYYNVPSFYNCFFLGSFYSGSNPSAISQTTDESRFFIGGNFSEKTSIDLSMYYTNANYHVQNPNDFSGHTYIDKPYTYAAPRLGFVWRPTAAVAIRASAGGGFAEAQLNELIGSNFPPFPNNQSAPTFYQAYLTNVNLQPEKSFAFDIGMDIRAHRGTVLSFDVYHANLYGQFYTSTALTSTNYKGTGLPLYTHAIGNLGASRYEGILADLRHDVPYGIYWTFSGGLTRGFVVGVPAGFYDTAACTNCANLTVVPNINFNGAFTPVSIPYAQGLGRLGYRWNPEKYVDLVATYYGNNNTYFRPAFVELDGHVGYPITRDLAMLLTFENITGIYDSAIQYQTAGNLTGAPAIAGAPSVLTSEMFGPRTVQLTVNIH